MNRKPPTKVIQQLRKEVGFGCPVPGCNSPYLTWHHFDPPWNVKQHHHPTGMIALCPIHHPQADRGAFTKEQLRQFKQPRDPAEVKGHFSWMRQNLLAVVGGNYYYDTPVIINLAGRPVISFERDGDGYLLLNIMLPTVSNEQRIRIERNVWERIGQPLDLDCPPSGRLLGVRYASGDSLNLEFRNLVSAAEFQEHYGVPFRWVQIQFPLTSLEINMNIAGRNLTFTPTETTLGHNVIKGGWFRGCGVGIQL